MHEHRSLRKTGKVVMKHIALVVGVIGALLGGLWLLQGLGIVTIQPILCFADCAPIQGPSVTWAIVGFLLVMAGAIAVLYSLKQYSARSRLEG
jgi:hypothetical protein